MCNLMCIFFLTLFIFTLNAQEISRIIDGGTIVGTTNVTEGMKKEYYAFLSIPFAEPPKRFESAVPKKPWKGVLNCTYEKDICIQNDGIRTPISGSENCLFLSVFTTNFTASSSVLVFFHGGGFTIGNGSYTFFGPDYLLDENLVVVLVQYRLGIFGFMSTGDEVCPGNLGLKDQLLALQWVNKQISHFGGNSSDVTIMGQSAGAISVSLHLHSLKSKDLFKGVIMNSGVSLIQWTLDRKAVKTAYSVGIAFGILTNNSTVLVNKLKKVDSNKLQTKSSTVASLIMIKNLVENGLLYGPVIEVDHETAFLTVKMENMLFTGNFTKVPVLAGFTSNEATILASPGLSTIIMAYFGKYDISPKDIVPVGITTSFFNETIAGIEIKQKFLSNYYSTFILAPIDAIIQYLNVEVFVRAINKFIMDVSMHVPKTYYYMFSYKGDTNFTHLPTFYKGVSHGDDVFYLFRSKYQLSARDQLMRKKMVRLWANFCKFSTPTPSSEPLLQNVTWLPASCSHPPFLMNIDTTLGKTANIYQKFLDFFERFFAKWGQGVYDTY